MDVVLITLGVLGLGAIFISAYVFTVAARNYVSDDHLNQNPELNTAADSLVARDPLDRRSNQPVQFPPTAQGVPVTRERRQLPDRRRGYGGLTPA
ncbi:MAG: hypothetical protein OEV47_05525 [Gammaproteobacteria bacterium]|jgi:hypothetical protein|nr:hypothetical protein [Gammaproteobacteria bacterium]